MLGTANNDIRIIKKIFEALSLVSDGTKSASNQHIDVAIVEVPVQRFGVCRDKG